MSQSSIIIYIAIEHVENSQNSRSATNLDLLDMMMNM